jgi:hypothetical protein
MNWFAGCSNGMDLLNMSFYRCETDRRAIPFARLSDVSTTDMASCLRQSAPSS